MSYSTAVLQPALEVKENPTHHLIYMLKMLTQDIRNVVKDGKNSTRTQSSLFVPSEYEGENEV